MSDTGDAALPPGWAWARLGVLGAWTGGGTPSKANSSFWSRGLIPWVSPKDMKADRVGQDAERITKAAVRASATKIVPRGSILCVIRSGILQHTFPVALAQCRVSLNQDMRALTTFDGIVPRYIQLYLQLQNDRLLHECSKDGTTVASINVDQLREFGIPIAPYPEQLRIVANIDALLDEVDEVEAAMKRARERMADYRASLLHAACTGGLTADWRAAHPHPEEDGPALLRRILAERRAAWERTELARLTAAGKAPRGESWRTRYLEPQPPRPDEQGNLPEGWTWASLDQLSSTSSYGTSAKCQPLAEGTPVIRIPNVKSGRVALGNMKYSTIDLGLDASDYLAPGDLIIVRTNGSRDLVGRAALVAVAPNAPTYFASYLIRFRLTAPEKLRLWVATLFESDFIRSQIEALAATSAGQYNISSTNLARVCLPIPPLAEAELLLANLNLASLELQELATTATQDLRQSIVHAAFSGRLVPQDPDDEPATALLARFQAEAAKSTPSRRSARASARP